MKNYINIVEMLAKIFEGKRCRHTDGTEFYVNGGKIYRWRHLEGESETMISVDGASARKLSFIEVEPRYVFAEVFPYFLLGGSIKNFKTGEVFRIESDTFHVRACGPVIVNRNAETLEIKVEHLKDRIWVKE